MHLALFGIEYYTHISETALKLNLSCFLNPSAICGFFTPLSTYTYQDRSVVTLQNFRSGADSK